MFPCQLLETGAQFALAGGSFLVSVLGAPPSFSLLAVYLCGYAVFLNDFLRQYTYRPTYGPFTEGQVVSVLVVVAGGVFFLF